MMLGPCKLPEAIPDRSGIDISFSWTYSIPLVTCTLSCCQLLACQLGTCFFFFWNYTPLYVIVLCQSHTIIKGSRTFERFTPFCTLHDCSAKQIQNNDKSHLTPNLAVLVHEKWCLICFQGLITVVSWQSSCNFFLFRLLAHTYIWQEHRFIYWPSFSTCHKMTYRQTVHNYLQSQPAC